MCIEFIYTLSTETETRTDGPPPPLNLSPLQGTKSYLAQAKNIKHSHVCYYTLTGDANKPIIQTLPLPETQPKCPPGWSAEAWDERTIFGTTRYHFYISAHKPDDILAVKVGDRRENEKWVYESINPTTVEKELMEPWFLWKLVQKFSKEEYESDCEVSSRR